ncbi:MAG: DEAD/DEAH box helicase [Opitutales bacterium]|nr:DEAD/DEAH box helicase [Opitutales bacterium]
MNDENNIQEATDSRISFDEMSLAEPILQAVRKAGYETPSPIQEHAIPPLLEGKDLLGVAQTGTGKTAAFSLPLLSRIDDSIKGAQILVLAPTRELALQVAEAMEGFAENLPNLRVVAVYGGTGYGEQIREFKRGAQVVVGTPGRVMDHIDKGYLKLNNLQALVLDEADEMLSMGFIDDIEWILEHTPQERQTALFSATMPKPIRKLAEKHLQDPEQVTIKVKAENSPNIRQRFIKVRQHEKRDMLTRLLEIEKFEAMLIFARTKNATMEIAEKLQGKGYPAEPLNGDMPQNLREKTVDRLKRGKINVLVATDVAARGLDVNRISHVLNYDAPFDLESYTHRIGRTGRAGREGDAIIFITNKEMRMLNAIERTLKVPCDQYVFPTLEEMNERREEEFFSKIEQGLKGNLDDYRKALQRYIEESGKDTLEVAASLAFLEAGKKALRYDSMPKSETKKPRREDRRERDRGDRRDFSSRDNDRSDRRSFRDDNLQSYRLEVGEFHGAQKGDIVGAIANEVGMDPREVGKIRMFKDHTFIDLPKDMPNDVFEALKKVWVQGHQMNISIDKGRPRPGGKSFSKGKKFGKGGDFRKKSKPRFRD